VDGIRIGRALRSIRIRLSLRQRDVAKAARVSPSLVAKLERGDVSNADLRRLEGVCQVLGVQLDIRVRWRGEGLDRLLDEAHARLVDRFVAILTEIGWASAVEVSYSEYGERGSIDVLGWHPTSRALLVIEVKSVVPDAQATILGLDRKGRLGAKVARDRGWDPRTVSRLLIVADSTTTRRRIARLDSMFRTAFPVRGHSVRQWLRAPDGAISGLQFLPDSTPGALGRPAAGRQRVNRPKTKPHAAG
jgi:transcriptional regulator with XRE-family HTH domain